MTDLSQIKFSPLRNNPGLRFALPVIAFLLIGFVGPLIIVLAFSFIPPKTFEFTGEWTFDNYRYIFHGSYYRGLLWSRGVGIVTVAILFLSCYPLAFGIAKVFGKWATPFTLAMVLPLFVSENVRLFGWTLILIKGGGILAGTMKFLFGLDPGTMGASSAFATLLGAAFLIYRRVASPRIMAAIAIGMVVVVLLFNQAGGGADQFWALPWFWHLTVGSFAFGAVFLATDPASASATETGQWVYGLLIGAMIVVFRVADPAHPDGVLFAILLGNIFAPLIDYTVVWAHIRKRARRNG